MKVGIFLCHCGGNISNVIDFAQLKNAANNIAHVAAVKEIDFLCSSAGQDMIKKECTEWGLDHMVVCACSPKLHGQTFMRLAEESGINRYLVDFANLREQCAWLYNNKSHEATLKAASLVRAAIAKVCNTKPLVPVSLKVNQSVLVIGGGISGITASLTLANQGIHVYLVEKDASIGGAMAKLGRIFSVDKLAEECASCTLSPIMQEVSTHPNITVLTISQVEEVRGKAGDFSVKIKQRPRYVDVKKCTACGDCAAICPACVPDEFMEGFTVRKAIYLPYSQAIPRAYLIDKENCNGCGACVQTCRSEAIDLEASERCVEVKVGAVVIATGHRMYNPAAMPHMGSCFSNVLTQIQVARLLSINSPTGGYLFRPLDSKPPKRIVMIQCVGSRNEKYGHTYCSKVCCMVALKHALLIKSQIPDAFITICYMDMRTSGMYEHYLLHAQEKGIRFLRGRPCEVLEDPITKNLRVRVYDTISSENLEIEADMVVLSTAMEPSESTKDTARRLGLQSTQHGFIKEEHSKLKSVQTSSAGIFVCGTAQGPKDITECIIQANAAASKTMELIGKGEVSIEPEFAIINYEHCDNCGKCARVCPHGAILINGRAYIDPIACSGCGGCVSECPNNAIEFPRYSDSMILAQIEAILEPNTSQIIAFLDDKISYVAADLAGANRLNYWRGVKIIRVASTLQLKFEHIIFALTHGACGVFLGEGSSGDPKKEFLAKEREQVYHSELHFNGIDPERLKYAKVYIPAYHQLVEMLNKFYAKTSDPDNCKNFSTCMFTNQERIIDN
ncbi:MAG: disulfide reductase [Candidatus Methanoperedenaceae archaeon]|nr:MAG: disulfide reductase [Candidatus Methanoperedenaceae archaeon]